jgi:hypothetical protein
MSGVATLASEYALELGCVLLAVGVAVAGGNVDAAPVAAVVGFFAGKSADSLRRAVA